LHLLPSGLSLSVQQLAATSPSKKHARVFFMVAASFDPAWASQTKIGNKNDTLEEAVFQRQELIFNISALGPGKK